MAKTSSFPVKSFELRGSSLSEKERAAAVRSAMTGRFLWPSATSTTKPKKSAKKSVAKKAATKAASGKEAKSKAGVLLLKSTATGSGQVKFSFDSRPFIVVVSSTKKRA